MSQVDFPAASLRLDDPHTVDIWMEQPEALAAAVRGNPEPLAVLRGAQVLIAQGQAHNALELSAVVDHPLAPGVHLLAQAALGLYKEVLAADPEPQGYGPLELESSCLAHYACAISASQLGYLEVASGHVHSAITLARALNLHHRLQTLTIESCRINALAGRGDKLKLQALLFQPMTERRRRWGLREQAEIHMGEGAYYAALDALGLPEQDGPEEAAMREFLHTAVGLPPVRPQGHPLLDETLPYLRLNRANLIQLEGRSDVDLRTITGEPERTYARIIEAVALLNTPSLAYRASALLGTEPPRRMDQRIYWCVLKLVAFVEGADDVDPLAVFSILEATLATSPTLEHMLAIIRTMSPNVFAFLAYSPLGAHLQGLHNTPLLTGKTILHEGKSYALPSSVGVSLILQQAHVPYDDIERYAKSRMHKKLARFGGAQRIANPGWAIRAAYLIRKYAADIGNETEVTRWDITYENALKIVSSDVRIMLLEYAPGA